MKTIATVFGIFVLMAFSASASIPTGFYLENQIDVTGDWKWDNGWQKGDFMTAQLNMAAMSHESTMASFVEEARYGAPWHLDYDSEAHVNAPVKFTNELNAITVNPPTTTPGNAWTKVHFVEMTGSEFSQSRLSINGYGNIFIKSTMKMQDEAGQVLDVNIN